MTAHQAEQSLLPTSNELDPQGVAKLKDVGMDVTVLNAGEVQLMQPPVLAEFIKTTPDRQALVDMIKQL
ncbi:hypothetical protein ACIGCM_12760 [Pseudomonas sp. NPDC078700]|uniref:hypothetical protein n=1 Tax=Pseudomonas sp. NPDC078700 TaxID=3364424 RepID=UPI0037C57484